MFFPNPLPETIFGGSKCQPMLKSAILDRFSIPLGSQNRPWSHMIGQKGVKKVSPSKYGDHPGADLVAIWRRKRSKDAFSSIWTRCLVDFGRIFNDFRLICCCYVSKFRRCLNINSLTPFHKHPHEKKTNPQATTSQTNKPYS